MTTTLTKPRRLPKSESTIARILEAAARLFVERSYADVTMNQIAFAAQLTKGAVYHHFTSKEQVYVDMLRAELSSQREVFCDALASGSTCRESLRNLVSSFLSMAPAQRGVMGLLRRDINMFTDPMRTDLIRAYQIALPVPVEYVLSDGMASGELTRTDARLLSWQFVALVEVMLNDYSNRVLDSEDARIDYVIGLFFNGASAQAKGVSS
jgi:AcrR family transcriptional regulator